MSGAGAVDGAAVHARWAAAMQQRMGEDKARVIDVFRQMDTDKNGSVSRAEFRCGLTALGFACSDAEFSALVRFLDKDGSKQLDYFEFSKSLKLRHFQSKRAQPAAGRPKAAAAPAAATPVAATPAREAASKQELLAAGKQLLRKKRKKKKKKLKTGASAGNGDGSSSASTTSGSEFSEDEVAMPKPAPLSAEEALTLLAQQEAMIASMKEGLSGGTSLSAAELTLQLQFFQEIIKAEVMFVPVDHSVALLPKHEDRLQMLQFEIENARLKAADYEERLLELESRRSSTPTGSTPTSGAPPPGEAAASSLTTPRPSQPPQRGFQAVESPAMPAYIAESPDRRWSSEANPAFGSVPSPALLVDQVRAAAAAVEQDPSGENIVRLLAGSRQLTSAFDDTRRDLEARKMQLDRVHERELDLAEAEQEALIRETQRADELAERVEQLERELAESRLAREAAEDLALRERQLCEEHAQRDADYEQSIKVLKASLADRAEAITRAQRELEHARRETARLRQQVEAGQAQDSSQRLRDLEALDAILDTVRACGEESTAARAETQALADANLRASADMETLAMHVAASSRHRRRSELQLSSLTDQVTALTEDLQALQAQHDSSVAEADQLRAHAADLKSQLDEARARNADSTGQLGDSTARLEAAERRADDAATKNRTLEQQLAAAEAAASELARSEGQGSLQALEGLHALADRVVQLGDGTEALAGQAEAQGRGVERLRGENTELRALVGAQQRQLVVTRQEQLASLRLLDELCATGAHIEAEAHEASSAAREQGLATADAVQHTTALARRNRALQADLRAAAEQERPDGEVEQLHERLQQKEGEAQDLDRRIRELNDARFNDDKQIRGLLATNDEQQQRLGRLEAALQATADEAGKDQAKLAARAEGLEADLRQHDERGQALQGEVTRLQLEGEALQQRRAQDEATIRELTKDLDDACSENEALAGQLEVQNRSFAAEAEEQLTQLQAQLDAERGRTAEAAARGRALGEQVGRLREQLDALEAEGPRDDKAAAERAEALAQENASLRGRLVETRAQALLSDGELEKARRSSVDQFELVQKRHQDIQVQYRECLEENVGLQRDLELKKIDAGRLAEEAGELRTALGDAKDEVAERDAELGEARDRLRSLEAANERWADGAKQRLTEYGALKEKLEAAELALSQTKHAKTGAATLVEEKDAYIDKLYAELHEAYAAQEYKLLNEQFFIAKYDYDPETESPNHEDKHVEIPLTKGQVVIVFGARDLDGFYEAEVPGYHGLVPSNFIEELPATLHVALGPGEAARREAATAEAIAQAAVAARAEAAAKATAKTKAHAETVMLLEADLTALREAAEARTAEVAGLELANETLGHELQALQALADDREQQLAEAEAARVQAAGQRDGEVMLAKSLHAASEEIEQLRRADGTTTVRLGEALAQNQQLIQEKAELVAQAQTLVAQNQQLVEQGQQLAAERQQLLGERQRLGQDGEHLAEDKQRLEGEIAHLQGRVQRLHQSSNDEAVDLHDRIFAAHQKLAQLQEERDSALQDHSLLRDALFQHLEAIRGLHVRAGLQTGLGTPDAGADSAAGAPPLQPAEASPALAARLEAEQRSLAASVDSLVSSLTALRSQGAVHAARHSELQRELLDQEKEAEATRQALREANAAVQALELANTERDGAAARAARARLSSADQRVRDAVQRSLEATERADAALNRRAGVAGQPAMPLARQLVGHAQSLSGADPDALAQSVAFLEQLVLELATTTQTQASTIQQLVVSSSHQPAPRPAADYNREQSIQAALTEILQQVKGARKPPASTPADAGGSEREMALRLIVRDQEAEIRQLRDTAQQRAREAPPASTTLAEQAQIDRYLQLRAENDRLRGDNDALHAAAAEEARLAATSAGDSDALRCELADTRRELRRLKTEWARERERVLRDLNARPAVPRPAREEGVNGGGANHTHREPEGDGQLLQLKEERKQLYGRMKDYHARFVRAERARKSLAYQKRYLILLIAGYEKCEENTLAIIARMGVQAHAGGGAESARSQALRRFRGAAYAVMAQWRMRRLVARGRREPRA